MARCGWCKTRDLEKVGKGGDSGLEPHKIPGTTRQCNGMATSQYSPNKRLYDRQR